MFGFKKWMDANKRKKLTGFFSFAGRYLSDREVRLVVNYAVEKGYVYDADIPEEEIFRLLGCSLKKNHYDYE